MPALTRPPHGAARTSLKGRLLHLKRRVWKRYPALVAPVQRLISRVRPRVQQAWSATFRECLSEQLAHWDAAEAYLRRDVARQILRDSANYGRHARGNLITVTSLLEQRLTGRDTLATYADRDFV